MFNIKKKRRIFEMLENRSLLTSISIVTNLNDSGAGSLRDAVDNGEDVIEFEAGLCGDLVLDSEISISEKTTIVGPRDKCITVKAFDLTPNLDNGDGGRAFMVNDGDNSVAIDVSISNLNLSGGDVTGNGGAVYNAEKLTLDNVCVDDNHATALGGGIYNWEELTVKNSTVTGNTADLDGGGIYNEDQLEVVDSVVSGNTAKDEGGGIYSQTSVTVRGSQITNNNATDEGGGIYSRGYLELTDSTVSGNTAQDDGAGIYSSGTAVVTRSTISDNNALDDAGGIDSIGMLTITDSTISGNVALDDGGGIQNQGTLNVTNSTLSGNLAGAYGGGIYNLDGTATIKHSTIVANIADGDNSGAGWGGGIATFDDATTTLILNNSIVAGNTEKRGSLATPNDIEVNGTSIDVANSLYNLIGDAGSAGGLTNGGAMGNIVGMDSGTGTRPLAEIIDTALQSNGGPTLTHLLIPGSKAIDAGLPAFTPPPATDQRGGVFDREVNSRVDIGAIEYVKIPEIDTVVIDDGGIQRSMVRSITVTFNNIVSIDPGAFTLTKTQLAPFGEPGMGTLVPLMGTVNVIPSVTNVGGQTVATLTFSGTGVETGSNSLEDGGYELKIDRTKVISSGCEMDSDYVDPFFRLFGDANGDRGVGIPDFAAVSAAFGATTGNPDYNDTLDFEGNGGNGVSDFNEFRRRFGFKLA